MTEPTSPPKRIDPFFEVVHDGEWNACVGIQGSAVNYVDGYIEAARELVAAVIDKRMVASRDTLTMPILYNCRHALELSLKFAIERLHRTGVIADTHPVNHDILSHWRHLQNAGIGGSKLVRIIGELEPFVVSLAGIDDDGQELRYARNSHGGRSLGGIALVNLPLIRRSIEELSPILEQLKIRVFDLEEERSTGSYTKECSRADLEEIARVLGKDASWRDPSFAEKKREVMDRFDLSSRKFSAAVTVIRRSRPLAATVGLESELLHLSDEKAIAALQLWAKAHPVRVHDPDDLGLDYFDCDWEKFEEEARTARELDEAVQNLLTLEELSDLEVLFYIGRDRVHGEHYEKLLVDTVAKHGKAESLWAGVHHMMSKTNLLDCVVQGAASVGRPSLAAKLTGARRVSSQATT
jgi:hypothetical protein